VSRRLPGAGRKLLRGGFRVTTRDKEIVCWIGRLRMASAAQVAERFRMGRAVTYARLSGLVHLGLLDHARIFHRAPGVESEVAAQHAESLIEIRGWPRHGNYQVQRSTAA
jgi:hypothetical protein